MFNTKAEAINFGQTCSGDDFKHLVQLYLIYRGKLRMAKNQYISIHPYREKLESNINLIKIALKAFNDNNSHEILTWKSRILEIDI